MSVDSITILGVSHNTAPVEVREQLAFSDDPEAAYRGLGEREGCEEFCFLSTCNRVEVIFTSPEPQKTVLSITRFLFEAADIPEEKAGQYTYVYNGKDAVIHLFRVAASLDSMVVGEPQILGQLKDAYKESADRDATGVILNRLFHKAFSVAKLVRTETSIGGSAVSISYAAVELGKKIFGDLTGKKVLLVGAGEMAELAAEHLSNQGTSGVVVANRTLERAVKLARRFEGKAVSLEETGSQLEEVDIMISSTGSTEFLFYKKDMKAIMRKRRNRPLFIIDIAVPRDLDPGINDLDNVFLYDVDDLNHVVEINKSERQQEADKAERLVKEEMIKFLHWLEDMELAPTITALRRKAAAVVDRELSRTLNSIDLNLGKKKQKSIEKMAFAIMNKILHNPVIYLKENVSAEERRQRLNHIRKMFKLDEDDEV
ncbi:MAG: glutamyl-tRNA reductase [Thermodesulfobacteriota bacterium]